jgi:Intracellular septation protein A
MSGRPRFFVAWWAPCLRRSGDRRGIVAILGFLLHNSEIYEIICNISIWIRRCHRRDRLRLPVPLSAGPPGRRARTDFGRVWSTAASSSTAQPIGTKRLNFYPECAIFSNHKVCVINISYVISKRCKMSTQSLPAPSLRTDHSLPAVRWVSRVVNYLIYEALWLILPAISGSKPSFLPALREGPGASALNSGETGAPPIARRLPVGDLVFSGLRALGRPVCRHRRRRRCRAACPIWQTGRRVEPMQVVVLGGATMLTQSPRFIMVKPTIVHFAVAAVMLRRGWMLRYLPEIDTTY